MLYSKHKLLNIIPMLLVLLLIFLCGILTSKATAEVLPKSTELRLDLNIQGEALTASDIEVLSESVDIKDCGFASEGDKSDVKNQTVTPVFINENYLQNCGFEIIGSNFTQDDISSCKYGIILDEKLARKIYFSTDIIGENFILNGKGYQVIGIIKENSSLLKNLSSDKNERVYLPYTLNKNSDKLTLKTVNYPSTSNTAAIFLQMDLKNYNKTDYLEKGKILENFQHIMYFTLFSAFAVIVLTIWWKISKSQISKIRESFEKNYLSGSVKSHWKNYLALLIFGIGIPTALIVLFSHIDMSIYIPTEFLPEDNLFDLGFYLTKIIDSAQEKNSMALVGSPYLSKLYEKTFGLTAIIDTVFFIATMGFLIYLFKITSRSKAQK